jgi:hypothetical protein
MGSCAKFDHASAEKIRWEGNWIATEFLSLGRNSFVVFCINPYIATASDFKAPFRQAVE